MNSKLDNLSISDDTETLKEEKIKVKSIEKYIYLFLKRFFDIICGIIGCILLIPFSIGLKIANMCCGDFGPLFYTQNRIGKNGKEFKFFKYRSMVVGADEILKKILEEGGELAEEYKVNKKLTNDPRITKVGHFIRRYSIDELPQLIKPVSI